MHFATGGALAAVKRRAVNASGSLENTLYLTPKIFPIFLNESKYGLSFYMQYLAHWPEYFQVAESPSGEIMGYSK
jgi:hypothetical protein